MVGRVAYIMSRFPHLPETFILREMIALERIGWEVELFPLIFQRQKIVHEQAQAWVARAHKIPWISWEMFLVNLRVFISQPKLYLSILIKVFWENIKSPSFLLRALILFPKAVLISKKVKDNCIEHIHVHYATHPALVAWVINKLTGITYSVTVHAHDIFVNHAMLETKLNGAIRIVAISEYNKNYLMKLLGQHIGEKTEVIHCGIEPKCYQFKNHRKVEDNIFEVVTVGSLQPYKGQVHLIQACAILQENGLEFKCKIIGGGELSTRLQKLVSRLSLEGRVELTGPKTQNEVADMLTHANCYIQPSVITDTGKMDGIPVAIMEAMASGVPVVATSISGIPELVKDGETGWLVSPGDARELAESIAHIFNHPKEAWARTRKAHDLILSDFELNANVKELSHLFRQIAVA